LSQILLVLLIVALVVYPFYEEHHLNIVRTDLAVTNLPLALKNIKIVYVTDILEGSRYSQSRVDGLINDINGLSADLVLLGGDYAESSESAIDFFGSLPSIHARLGVYGVLGETDRTEPETNLPLLVKAMTAAGVTPLVNNVAQVRLGQTTLILAGIDDLLGGSPDMEAVASQVKQSDFVILLGNNPDLLSSALKATGSDGDNHWFDLALFGHTLGGQITFLGAPLIAQLVPDLGARYLTGWRSESRADILVSNGVGTRFFPARIFAPSQLHLITLKAQ
jgi:uncharacterized protein